MPDPHLGLVRRATAGILFACLATLLGLNGLAVPTIGEPDGYGFPSPTSGHTP